MSNDARPSELPATVEDFLAAAYAMEVEASDRYAELAEQMDAHHNSEVAELFSKLSRIEGLHRDQIMEQAGWTSPPRASVLRWEGPEGAETTDYGDLHYLMQPWHALRLAEHNERRAANFFQRFADADLPEEIRRAAAEMAEEEREHVRLIQEWLKRFPEPDEHWENDLDPPQVVD